MTQTKNVTFTPPQYVKFAQRVSKCQIAITVTDVEGVDRVCVLSRRELVTLLALSHRIIPKRKTPTDLDE